MVMSISMFGALALNLIGVNPVKALIYTAILYGLTAPVLIGMILHICNNKNNGKLYQRVAFQFSGDTDPARNDNCSDLTDLADDKISWSFYLAASVFLMYVSVILSRIASVTVPCDRIMS